MNVDEQILNVLNGILCWECDYVDFRCYRYEIIVRLLKKQVI